MISGCDHIGIQVRDLDRSIDFYGNKLGLELIGRWSMTEAYVRRVVGYPDVQLEIGLLRIPGSRTFLEILEYRNVASSPVDPATANPGTGHFCLFVEDLDAMHARLSAQGVEFVSDVQIPTIGPNKDGRLVYMKDPDGIRVELVQTNLRSDWSPRPPLEERSDAGA